MAWHSTHTREELLVALAGRVDVEVRSGARAVRRIRLAAGRCVFLPSHLLHSVVNRSRTPATYLYVTGPAAS